MHHIEAGQYQGEAAADFQAQGFVEQEPRRERREGGAQQREGIGQGQRQARQDLDPEHRGRACACGRWLWQPGRESNLYR